jgi:hypothetical protein
MTPLYGSSNRNLFRSRRKKIMCLFTYIQKHEAKRKKLKNNAELISFLRQRECVIYFDEEKARIQNSRRECCRKLAEENNLHFRPKE